MGIPEGPQRERRRGIGELLHANNAVVRLRENPVGQIERGKQEEALRGVGPYGREQHVVFR